MQITVPRLSCILEHMSLPELVAVMAKCLEGNCGSAAPLQVFTCHTGKSLLACSETPRSLHVMKLERSVQMFMRMLPFKLTNRSVNECWKPQRKAQSHYSHHSSPQPADLFIALCFDQLENTCSQFSLICY